MKYEVWYYKKVDGRATEYAFLDDDYQYAGEIKADDLKHLARLLLTVQPVDTGLQGARPLRIGDVVCDPTRQYWVFTPGAVWARVHAFK